MAHPELNKLLACMETIQEHLSPKATVEQLILFLLVAMKEEYPLTELASRMDWTALKTSRQVNTMADHKYGGGQYEPGYEVLYTQEDKAHRISKNAFLTHKGKELRDQLIQGVKGSKTKQSP